jgi:hypothetical protein
MSRDRALLVLLAFWPALAWAETPAPPAPGPQPAFPDPYAPPPGYVPPPSYAPPSPYGPPGYRMWPPLAEEPPPPEHDGFYLRLALGGGYGRVSMTAAGEQRTMVGSSLASSLAVGGAIAPNLILYGGFVDTSLLSPDYKVDGTTVTKGGSSILFSGFGPGLAYYFMPSNTYLAGTLLFARLAQAAPSGAYAISNRGPGFEGLLGKEWWVSENWGLGATAQIVLARVPAKGIDDASYDVVQAALLLSATFN